MPRSVYNHPEEPSPDVGYGGGGTTGRGSYDYGGYDNNDNYDGDNDNSNNNNESEEVDEQRRPKKKGGKKRHYLLPEARVDSVVRSIDGLNSVRELLRSVLLASQSSDPSRQSKSSPSESETSELALLTRACLSEAIEQLERHTADVAAACAKTAAKECAASIRGRTMTSGRRDRERAGRRMIRDGVAGTKARGDDVAVRALRRALDEARRARGARSSRPLDAPGGSTEDAGKDGPRSGPRKERKRKRDLVEDDDFEDVVLPPPADGGAMYTPREAVDILTLTSASPPPSVEGRPLEGQARIRYVSRMKHKMVNDGLVPVTRKHLSRLVRDFGGDDKPDAPSSWERPGRTWNGMESAAEEGVAAHVAADANPGTEDGPANDGALAAQLEPDTSNFVKALSNFDGIVLPPPPGRYTCYSPYQAVNMIHDVSAKMSPEARPERIAAYLKKQMVARKLVPVSLGQLRRLVNQYGGPGKPDAPLYWNFRGRPPLVLDERRAPPGSHPLKDNLAPEVELPRKYTRGGKPEPPPIDFADVVLPPPSDGNAMYSPAEAVAIVKAGYERPLEGGETLASRNKYMSLMKHKMEREGLIPVTHKQLNRLVRQHGGDGVCDIPQFWTQKGRPQIMSVDELRARMVEYQRDTGAEWTREHTEQALKEAREASALRKGKDIGEVKRMDRKTVKVYHAAIMSWKED